MVNVSITSSYVENILKVEIKRISHNHLEDGGNSLLKIESVV